MKVRVSFVGRIGKDAEVRHFENGNAVITFSVATNHTWKSSDGEKKEETDWHTVKRFVKEVNDKFVEMFAKGKKVEIDGFLRYDKWEDDHDQKRVTAWIELDRFEFV